MLGDVDGVAMEGAAEEVRRARGHRRVVWTVCYAVGFMYVLCAVVVARRCYGVVSCRRWYVTARQLPFRGARFVVGR